MYLKKGGHGGQKPPKISEIHQFPLIISRTVIARIMGLENVLGVTPRMYPIDFGTCISKTGGMGGKKRPPLSEKCPILGKLVEIGYSCVAHD